MFPGIIPRQLDSRLQRYMDRALTEDQRIWQRLPIDIGEVAG